MPTFDYFCFPFVYSSHFPVHWPSRTFMGWAPKLLLVCLRSTKKAETSILFFLLSTPLVSHSHSPTGINSCSQSQRRNKNVISQQPILFANKYSLEEFKFFWLIQFLLSMFIDHLTNLHKDNYFFLFWGISQINSWFD